VASAVVIIAITVIRAGCGESVTVPPDGPSAAPDAVKVTSTLDERCARADGEACFQQAELTRAKNPTAAAKQYEAGCEASHGRSCEELARMYARGADGLKRDYGRSFKLFEKACTLRVQGGCLGKGPAYEHGRGAPIDEAKAVAIYKKICAAGGTAGCASLGNLYLDGRGVAQDQARGIRVLEDACAKHDLLPAVTWGSPTPEVGASRRIW